VSLRRLVRRILGRGGIFTLRNIISEIYFRIGLYEDPRKYPNGITAMVITYNEEDWVEPSILSVKDLVDEYVVMDSSTDKTPEIIEKIKREYGLNIKLLRVPPGDIVGTRNRALRESSYKWILVWDGDFVLFEDKIRIIRDLIEKLDPRKHYLVYWPLIQLCGDLRHTCRDPLHIEHWLYTKSSETRYDRLGPVDTLIAPLKLYKAILLKEPMGLHIHVRNPKRTAIRHLWYMYRELFDRTREDPEELARKIALEKYGVEDLEALGRKIQQETAKDLPIYQGSYPRILEKYIRERYQHTI